MSSTITSELLEEVEPGKKVTVGSLITQRPISGSRVNDCGIVEISLQKNMEDPGFMTWLLAAKFWVEGSPRFQQVWDVKEMVQRGDLVVLTRIILKPEGMCIACAGTGTFQASRHKATAKCPACKGRGFVTGVWPAEEEPKKEGTKDDDRKEGTQAGGVVAEGQDAVRPDPRKD